MNKKIFYITVVVSLLAIGLFGCQPTPSPVPTDKPAQPTAEQVKPTEAAAAPTVEAAKPTDDVTQPTKAAEVAKKMKVAMVLHGAINDKSWNEAGYNGLKMIEKELGAEVAFMEKVALTDAEESMRTYASQGYDLVIGHGDEFSEAGKVVAPEFPAVKFAVVNGAYTADNLASISMFDEQVSFLAGYVAAKTTKSKVVGYIGGLEIPPVVRNGKGFEAGVKYVDPTIEVKIKYLGDFNDAAKGKEAAMALGEEKVDVMYYYVDQAMLGIQEAAKAKSMKLIGCMFDQHPIAPDLILTSAIQDTATAILNAGKDAQAGKLEGKVYLNGLDSGAMGLAPFYGSVSKEIEDGAEQVKKDILSGKIVVERGK